MDLVTAVKTCFAKYADIQGRASRAEYWFFFLFNTLGSIIVGLLNALLAVTSHEPVLFFIPLLSWIYSLVMLAPNISVSVRRLHDINKSGWWLLFLFIPLVGWVLVLMWACTEGTRGTNDYGPEPAKMSSSVRQGQLVNFGSGQRTVAVARGYRLSAVLKSGKIVNHDFRDGESFVIGRSGDCAVVLDDGSISRRHARIEARNGEVVIEDLGSTNGSFISQRKLAPGTAEKITPSSNVVVGSIRVALSVA